MKNNKFSTFYSAVFSTVVFAAFVACGGDGARLSGHFIGAAGGPVTLERVVPGATVSQADTLTTNDKGEFSVRVALPDGQPTIFNLRYEDDMVPLLISPGERVSVMSLGNLNGYRVSGSPESELVWRLHGILTGGAAALDSIYTLFASSNPEETMREQLRRAYLDRYLKVKRQQISFIVENASSLAAVYALYQRLPGDEVLFNGETDYIYYQMVADSVRGRYPESRYLKALEKEVLLLTARHSLENRIAGEMVSVDYPDIELPDMYGADMRLSSLAGKVIVLDFWRAAETAGRINNAEMKELWSAFVDRGLAIYQVSLDTDKALWINAVQEQKLPWITVCDFRGNSTRAVGLYNLSRVPYNFIIDRRGNIAGQNLYGEELRKKLEELL